MANSWQEYPLSEIVELVIDNRGRNPSSYSDTGIPVIDNYLITSEGEPNLNEVKRYISPEIYESFIRKYNQPEDVLLTLVGNGFGKVAISPKEKCIIIQNTIGLRTKEGFDNLFLYYLLKGNRVLLTNLNRGAAQPSIKVGDVLGLKFRFPAYEEQKSIGEVLHLLDKKIKLNSQTNQTLEQMAQALFKSWFVDFDPVIDNALAAGNDIPDALQHKAEQRLQAQQLSDFKPLPDDIRALFPSDFEQTDEPSIGIVGWIPKGWSAGNLTSLANFTSNRIDGTALTLDNYISTDNMLSNKGGVSTASKVPDIKTTPSFKPGDILISNIRPYFKKIWFATFSGGRSNDVLGFEAIDEQCKEYLLNLLYQDVFFDYMMTTSKGSKMPRGDKKAIMDWPVVIPPSSLQKFFSEHVKNYYQVIPIRNKESEALSMLRDTLLPKLISGEISINKEVA